MISFEVKKYDINIAVNIVIEIQNSSKEETDKILKSLNLLERCNGKKITRIVFQIDKIIQDFIDCCNMVYLYSEDGERFKFNDEVFYSSKADEIIEDLMRNTEYEAEVQFFSNGRESFYLKPKESGFLDSKYGKYLIAEFEGWRE